MKSILMSEKGQSVARADFHAAKRLWPHWHDGRRLKSAGRRFRQSIHIVFRSDNSVPVGAFRPVELERNSLFANGNTTGFQNASGPLAVEEVLSQRTNGDKST
jgi:hypothetical protein